MSAHKQATHFIYFFNDFSVPHAQQAVFNSHYLFEFFPTFPRFSTFSTPFLLNGCHLLSVSVTFCARLVLIRYHGYRGCEQGRLPLSALCRQCNLIRLCLCRRRRFFLVQIWVNAIFMSFILLISGWRLTECEAFLRSPLMDIHCWKFSLRKINRAI